MAGDESCGSLRKSSAGPIGVGHGQDPSVRDRPTCLPTGFVRDSILPDPPRPNTGRQGGMHRNLDPAYAIPEMRLVKNLVVDLPHRTSGPSLPWRRGERVRDREFHGGDRGMRRVSIHSHCAGHTWRTHVQSRFSTTSRTLCVNSRRLERWPVVVSPMRNTRMQWRASRSAST